MGGLSDTGEHEDGPPGVDRVPVADRGRVLSLRGDPDRVAPDVDGPRPVQLHGRNQHRPILRVGLQTNVNAVAADQLLLQPGRNLAVQGFG